MLAHLPPSPAYQIGAALRRRLPQAVAIKVECTWVRKPSRDVCRVGVLLPTMAVYGCEAIVLVPAGNQWAVVETRRGSFKDCPIERRHGMSLQARQN